MSDDKLKEDIHVPLTLAQGTGGGRVNAGQHVKKAPTAEEQFMFPRRSAGPIDNEDDETPDVVDLMSHPDDPDAYDPLMGMPHPLDFDAD